MLKNSRSSYGSVAKWLHWLIALWVLAAYLIILYLKSQSDAFPLPGLNIHKVVGFSILVPVLLRLYWRATNIQPALPDHMPRWQRRASGLSHGFLYFFLIAMPVTGYLGNGGGVDYGAFRIPPFLGSPVSAWIYDMVGISDSQWDTFFDTLHYGIMGPWLFWMLIAVHAGAAIWHHHVQKDDVFKRMLPGRNKK